MALFTSISTPPLSVSVSFNCPKRNYRRFSLPIASLSSSSPDSSPRETIIPSNPSTNSSSPNSSFNYALPNPNGNPVLGFARSTESTVERMFYAYSNLMKDFLACPFIEQGCVFIVEAYKVYWASCVKGIHTGQMVLRLVEAIGLYQYFYPVPEYPILGLFGHSHKLTARQFLDGIANMDQTRRTGLRDWSVRFWSAVTGLDVYLAGTVMLIFGMGLYGLFISNVPPDVPSNMDRALKGSSLFGMFALKERPKWMKISSLDELKTKVGHVIVMILLVKMFERSKMVTIATGMDLLSYSACIFLSSASLYILHNLRK
ncbi:hypothetical protein HHK36_019779 [Tetracentron sinense]|uniref:Uncharacterized protein n=1 Tax=Tetracentron sinense TaxID=13715 RepID=A0A834YWU3_TETSI|nr:hypothetical protein HHK36_019779 [Tetracentron sinense]